MLQSKNKRPVIFIMGPTASGKTALAIDLVQKGIERSIDNKDDLENSFCGFEIISVDSTLVYTQLNIGSAKPNDHELLLAPHHLIDFIDPQNSYSVSQFYEDANDLIEAIHQRNKIPLLVGGTMLYFKALLNGLAKMPATDEEVRSKIQQKLKIQGIETLYSELTKIDPVTANRLHTNDTQRITRALEVYQMSGKPLSQWHKEQSEHEFPYPLLSIAISPEERKTLHKRIEARFERMLNNGFLQEMSDLYYRGDLNLDCPSMRSVGYRQYWQYMEGELTLTEAKEKAIIATRQLAKRQLTWLRTWPDVYWFDLLVKSQHESCYKLINDFLVSKATVI